MPTRRKLRDIQLGEISLVDEPASTGSDIAIIKQKDSPMDKDKVERLNNLNSSVHQLVELAKESGHKVEKLESGEVKIEKGSIEPEEMIDLPDGTKVAKSAVDPGILTFITKQAEELAMNKAALERTGFEKRAETELRTLAGSVDTKVELLKAIDTISDEKAEGAEKSPRDLVKEMVGKAQRVAAFTETGTAASPADDGSSPLAKFNSLVKDYAMENSVSTAAATAAVRKTAEGAELFHKRNGH